MGPRPLLSAALVPFLMALSVGLTDARADSINCDPTIEGVLADTAGVPMGDAIDLVSRQFLGKKYVLGPLGEGEVGEYDQSPRSRLDVFDCTTFVETMISLARSTDAQDFQANMDRIRYRDGQVGYATRNHFPEADWIPNNTAAGLVRDITSEVAGDGVLKFSHARNDKRSWYRAKTLDSLHLPGADAPAKARALERLRHEGDGMAVQHVKLGYIPTESLRGDPRLIERIPSGSVINIVRKDWAPPGAGTPMIVSHTGFAIRIGGVLYFRNASSVPNKMQVLDIPLAEYLAPYLGHPTVRGINILEVSDQAASRR
jgi:hypothetical protein